MRQLSRRKLLSTGAQAVVAGTVALSGLPAARARASSKAGAQAVDYYQKLGVTPFINAAGTYTVLSASTMPDEVQAAVASTIRTRPCGVGVCASRAWCDSSSQRVVNVAVPYPKRS